MNRYGVDKSQEISPSKLRRNTESNYEFILSLFKGENLSYMMMFASFLGLVIPGVALPILLIFFFHIRRNFAYKPTLPFYLPASSGEEEDLHNIEPKKDKKVKTEGAAKGTKNTYAPAEGIAYIGNCAKTNQQIWLTNDVMRQHLLMLGTTGAGKSVSITSITINTHIMASGYSYIDGKADLKLPIEHMANAWRFNNVDDVFMINYITGNMDQWGEQTKSLSNSFNFAAKGASGSIIELLKSLLDGDNDVWAKRAETFISGGTRVLVYLRDIGEINLSIRHFLEILTPEKCGLLIARSDEFKDDRAFQSQRPNEEATKPFIPKDVLSELESFIRTIPGMKPQDVQTLMMGGSLKQNPTVYDQFGYISMQVIPMVNELKSSYKHIFDVIQGHVDMDDIVLQRRTLLVLLPALEKSPASLASLGRIVLAAQKSMMGGALGSHVEGSVKENIHNRPTSSNTPFLSIADEVGYYFVPGTAVAAAQSRSIGFSMFFLAQDLPAMKKLGEEAAKEVESVLGNTNSKFGGRVLNKETFEMFKDAAGEAKVAQLESQEYEKDALLNHYKERNVSYVKQDRLNQRDFSGLIEGQVFMQHKDEVVRVDIPYLQAPELDYVVLNDFIPCPPPSGQEIKAIKSRRSELIERFRQRLESPEMDTRDKYNTAPNLAEIANTIDKVSSAYPSVPLFAVVIASAEEFVQKRSRLIAELFEPIPESEKELIVEPFEEERSDSGEEVVGGQLFEEHETQNELEKRASELAGMLFGTNLNEEELYDDLKQINSLMGDNEETASSAASRTIDNIKNTLKHPSEPTLNKDEDKTIECLNELLDAFD